jgi:hypothetical protein
MTLIPTVVKVKPITQQTVENIVDSMTGLMYVSGGGVSGGYIPPKNRKDLEERLRQAVQKGDGQDR